MWTIECVLIWKSQESENNISVAVWHGIAKLLARLPTARPYTVKKVMVFPVPSRDVNNRTIPGWE